MEERRLKPREREQLRHRKEMVDAGLALFSKKEYQGVSTREIAREAEFGTRTLYRFF